MKLVGPKPAPLFWQTRQRTPAFSSILICTNAGGLEKLCGREGRRIWQLRGLRTANLANIKLWSTK